jgi:thiamine-phosphate pyrophosphorylase
MNYRSNYSNAELRKARKDGFIDKKVIALGGIDINNIKDVKKYGFGGAAILGALWNKFDLCTTNNYDDLIEHFKKLKKLAD